MKQINTIYAAFQQVYARKRYYFLSFSFGFLIFAFHSFLNNYSLVIHEFSPRLIFLLLMGTLTTRTTMSLLLLTVISILGGIVFTAAVYLLRRQVTSGVKTGFLGIFMSVIAPACSSCALGILGLLGLGGVLVLLPFKGQELTALAIIILFFSLHSLAKKIVAATCTIQKK